MSPLEAATTDELIAELKTRFDAVVVAYMRPMPNEPVPTTYYGVSWGGAIVSCIGLAHHARERLSVDAISSPDAGEDDTRGN